jgi:hypothetical protein
MFHDYDDDYTPPVEEWDPYPPTYVDMGWHYAPRSLEDFDDEDRDDGPWHF